MLLINVLQVSQNDENGWKGAKAAFPLQYRGFLFDQLCERCSFR